jgi:ArsR family transcriptional regulator
VLRPEGLLAISDFDQHANEAMRTVYGDRWLGFRLEHLTDFLGNAGFIVRSAARVPVEQGLSLHFILATSVASDRSLA